MEKFSIVDKRASQPGRAGTATIDNDDDDYLSSPFFIINCKIVKLLQTRCILSGMVRLSLPFMIQNCIIITFGSKCLECCSEEGDSKTAKEQY